eukprot:TRINITY_DN3228_c1_g1_i1.p1 TRINITY_DN3228_c1_g1~~TRINITY_DN3228_c1_g1_i1.p1  ORF type:complete len:212 (-),score=56.50 TRINITY_DN3228_c1_g1_i1:895-1530(-)
MSDNFVVDQLQALPIRELVAAPLVATAKANQDLITRTVNHHLNYGFEDDNGTKVMQNIPVKFPGNREVNFPVPLLHDNPSLTIESADVNFSIEVKSTQQLNKSSRASAKYKVNAFFYKSSGSVTATKQFRRKTDHSAHYEFHVKLQDVGLNDCQQRIFNLAHLTIPTMFIEEKTTSDDTSDETNVETNDETNDENIEEEINVNNDSLNEDL